MDATPSDVHQPGPLGRLKQRRRLFRGIAELLRKATAVQPRQPAGAPGGKGGQFAPKGHLSGGQLGQKIGFQQGTNPGGTYSGDGSGKLYVKEYKDHARAAGEHLANQMYRDLQIAAPKSYLVQGKPGVHASRIEDGPTVETLGSITTDQAKDFAHGFAADVLLGNWDAVGATKDNLLVTKDGIMRIDNGGTLLMRAQEASGKKPEHLLDKITEFDGFLDKNTNAQYASVMEKAGFTKDSIAEGGAKHDQVRMQVQSILALHQNHGGWDNYLKKVNPEWSGKDRDRVVQMLEARTKLLAERVGLTPNATEQAALHTAAGHNTITGIELPPPSSGAGYAAQGYNKGLAQMHAVLGNSSLSHADKMAQIEGLKGPTESHFFGKKFKSLKGQVLAQLEGAKGITATEKAPAPKPVVPSAPQIPLPNNSGIHKAKWNQKTIDALHAAAHNADPLTAVGQIELGPSHSGPVKKYKAELLQWAAGQLPGSVDKDGKVTVAAMPKATPLGVTPGATKMAAFIHAKNEAAKNDWEMANPIPKVPGAMKEYTADELGKPSTKTLLRVQLERAARTHPDLVDAVLKSNNFSYLEFQGLNDYKKAIKEWSVARDKATGGLTGKKGDNISGFEIHEPSSTGGLAENAPHKYPAATHAKFKDWGYAARKSLHDTDKEASEALSYYQGSSYDAMNQHLLYTPEGYQPKQSKYKAVAALQRAFDHPMAKVPHDVTVHRGISSDALAHVLATHASKLQGSTVTMKTFSSSSLDGAFGEQSQVQIKIHAKKGTRALYLNASHHDDHVYEKELLFPAHTKMRVHSIKKNEYGRVTVEMTVVD